MDAAELLAKGIESSRWARIVRKRARQLARKWALREREATFARANDQMQALQILYAAGSWSPHYEELLRYQYTRLLGTDARVVFDIGAHGGLHTIQFLELVGPEGRVVAFEPLPDLAEALRTKLPDPRLVVEAKAVSDFDGSSSFVVADGALEESGLRQRVYNQPDVVKPREIDVEVVTVDSYARGLSRLDFIKLDIEGAEISALRGARRTLERFRPIVSVEYGAPSFSAYGHKAETLFDFASEADMILVDLFGNPIQERRHWVRFCDRMYWDYFLMPREKIDLISRLRASPW